MLEASLSGGALLLIVGQKRLHEVDGDWGESFAFVVNLSRAYGLHDVVVSLSTEWGRSAQQDIHDDTDGPDVALVSVLLVEDLRGNIVRGSELLVEFL